MSSYAADPDVAGQLRRRRDAASRLAAYDGAGHVDPLDALRDELLHDADPRRWCCLGLSIQEAAWLGRRGYFCSTTTCARERAEGVA